MSNITNYFKNTNVFIEGNKALRKIQRNAHNKLKKSFNNSLESHKIVVLPTGSGKTGVIAIAPYEISEGRVLVITPSLIIREGISDAFDTRTMFNFWSERKVILDDEKLPKVYRYSGYKNSNDKKRILKTLKESNIVIANIHKVYNSSSRKDLVTILDPDFFDMIIIDEAHHAAADSWLKTFQYFNAKKVIKLTATPYRADAKDLDGEIIYRYELADAIKDKIVKNLVAEDYTNEKLEFEIDGEKVDKDEALNIMDKNWVTRSVAYSKQCSRTIVEMSIEKLKEKRELGKAHHQIMAVACSIEHAEQIKEIYAEYNLKAEYVSSDRPEESEKAIIEFKKGIIDVIVNVNMLGEGFDHPNVSIAAIFRPFRTLPPYAQFIGRALRRIQGKDTIDNVAHVIYHKELELDDLWEYYTKQKVKASRRIFIEREFNKDNGEERDRDVGEVTIDGKTISNVKTFLDDNISKEYSKAILKSIEEIENKIKNDIEKMKQAGISEDAIADFEKARRRKLDEKITNKREQMREDLIREELHELHVNDMIEHIDKLIQETGISAEGMELSENTSNKFLQNVNNIAYMKKYINLNLKRKLKRSIYEYETYDFKQARELIPDIMSKIKEKIERLGEE